MSPLSPRAMSLPSSVRTMSSRIGYSILNRTAAVRPEEIPHDLVVGVPRGLRAVSGGVAVYNDSRRVFPESFKKLVAGLIGRRMPQHDFVQHSHPAATDLR